MLSQNLNNSNNNKNLALQLNIKAKRELYNTFFLYDLPSIFLSTLTKKLNISFKKLLLANFFLYRFTSNLSLNLIRARVVITNNSFLYFDIGSKYTVLRPKFKVFFSCFFKSLLGKELLLFLQTPLLGFLKFKDMQYLLKFYKFLPLKKDYTLSIKAFYCIKSFLRKFICFYICTKHFFFYKLFVFFFSTFQKKINFLQFNIFFKKYK